MKTTTTIISRRGATSCRIADDVVPSPSIQLGKRTNEFRKQPTTKTFILRYRLIDRSQTRLSRHSPYIEHGQLIEPVTQAPVESPTVVTPPVASCCVVGVVRPPPAIVVCCAGQSIADRIEPPQVSAASMQPTLPSIGHHLHADSPRHVAQSYSSVHGFSDSVCAVVVAAATVGVAATVVAASVAAIVVGGASVSATVVAFTVAVGFVAGFVAAAVVGAFVVGATVVGAFVVGAAVVAAAVVA